MSMKQEVWNSDKFQIFLLVTSPRLSQDVTEFRFNVAVPVLVVVFYFLWSLAADEEQFQLSCKYSC